MPGSFELPLVAKCMAKSGNYDAVLTIGAVVSFCPALCSLRNARLQQLQAKTSPFVLQVRGATTHYEAVVNSATSGTLNAGLESGVPVVFGVLTTETMEQVSTLPYMAS